MPGEVEAVRKFLNTYEEVIEAEIQEVDALLQRVNFQELKPENVETVRSELIQFKESSLIVKMDDFCEDLMELIEMIRSESNQAEAILKAAEALRLQIIAGSMLVSVLLAILLVISTLLSDRASHSNPHPRSSTIDSRVKF